jgi:hypothetical protein
MVQGRTPIWLAQALGHQSVETELKLFTASTLQAYADLKTSHMGRADWKQWGKSGSGSEL